MRIQCAVRTALNYATRDCHVTRTEVVATLARPGVDTNGNVKWLEAN